MFIFNFILVYLFLDIINYREKEPFSSFVNGLIFNLGKYLISVVCSILMGVIFSLNLGSGILKLRESSPINLSSILDFSSSEIEVRILISIGKSLQLALSVQFMINSSQPH